MRSNDDGIPHDAYRYRCKATKEWLDHKIIGVNVVGDANYVSFESYNNNPTNRYNSCSQSRLCGLFVGVL